MGGGKLLLQQGAIEKALPHFSYILTHYPNQGHLVYDVWTKVVNDPDFFLERLVPKDSSSLNRYLVYLYETGDKESARKVWAMKAALGYPSDRDETLRHIDFLISYGELGEAFQVWKARLREEGLPIASDGNLVTDGGFENEKIWEGVRLENRSGEWSRSLLRSFRRLRRKAFLEDHLQWEGECGFSPCLPIRRIETRYGLFAQSPFQDEGRDDEKRPQDGVLRD